VDEQLASEQFLMTTFAVVASSIVSPLRGASHGALLNGPTIEV
jgi:hypothetical protein